MDPSHSSIGVLSSIFQHLHTQRAEDAKSRPTTVYLATLNHALSRDGRMRKWKQGLVLFLSLLTAAGSTTKSADQLILLSLICLSAADLEVERRQSYRIIISPRPDVFIFLFKNQTSSLLISELKNGCFVCVTHATLSAAFIHPSYRQSINRPIGNLCATRNSSRYLLGPQSVRSNDFVPVYIRRVNTPSRLGGRSLAQYHSINTC